MENKIDLNKISELLSNEFGLDKNTLWENSEKFKIMEIEMKEELNTFSKNPLTKEISYKDRESYIKNSFMYKIMENQSITSKEEFLSQFKEEGEIFEKVVEEIDFDKLKDTKIMLINAISSNEETLVDFYSNGFFDNLARFDDKIEIYFSNIILKNIEGVFFNLIYQKDKF
ncbi:hypothetical protein N5U04_07865 [Aliarcobacter butzleri]|uniref:hypothetical protein n=1 Tax=Aliarcobacter butzleri TaxID=28197 RepID=UPI0021B413AB|nr:hypothetical protein [Aliarcobacter butzleri]MCT7549977.1 hypothetical protein [Aliarcobacter butzleri]MCT7559475.1 hypothetical protein [Aliarcobacter butzleri]